MSLEQLIENFETRIRSAFSELGITVHFVDAYGEITRTLYQGTVGDFVKNYVKTNIKNPDLYEVCFYGNVAYTDADESIPIYNRPIEVHVI